jgi:hypothetical protein
LRRERAERVALCEKLYEKRRAEAHRLLWQRYLGPPKAGMSGEPCSLQHSTQLRLSACLLLNLKVIHS